MIAGKRPTGAIGAVLSRRQSNDQQLGVGVAERGNRPAEVAGLVQAHGIEKSAQARAAPAHGIKCAVHTGS
jgi:hypothetical protein